jgi:GH25 family lysozyme M1 (1,4-beta-N-acetylmuramidase)
MPIDYRASIDSLIQSNNALTKHQEQIDSIIIIYSARVDSVDNRIDSVKEKTIIIKKYYHEVSSKVDTFQVSQLDSFFKARYPQP